MSCDFCGVKQKNLLERDFSCFRCSYEGFGTTTKYAVFIDRGYLRLVDTEDSQCLDHGELLEINHCPMCGNKLGEGE